MIMSQSRALSTAMTGAWPGETMQRDILAIARGPLPYSVASPMVFSIIAKELGGAAQLPEVQRQLTGQVDAVLSPYYREMLRYDPESDIAAISVPWLALNGDKDLQVVNANLATISTLNPGASTTTVAGHNHLFQKATTGLPQEYPTLMITSKP